MKLQSLTIDHTHMQENQIDKLERKKKTLDNKSKYRYVDIMYGPQLRSIKQSVIHPQQ